MRGLQSGNVMCAVRLKLGFYRNILEELFVVSALEMTYLKDSKTRCLGIACLLLERECF